MQPIPCHAKWKVNTPTCRKSHAKWKVNMPKCGQSHAKWKGNTPTCSKSHAKWKVNMPKCGKYHTKWKVNTPTCRKSHAKWKVNAQMWQIPCKMTNSRPKPLQTLGKLYQPRIQKKIPNLLKKNLKLFHTHLYGASYRGDSHGVSPSQFGTRIELNKWQRPPAAIKGIGGIAVETGTAALTCFPSVVHLSWLRPNDDMMVVFHFNDMLSKQSWNDLVGKR